MQIARACKSVFGLVAIGFMVAALPVAHAAPTPLTYNFTSIDGDDNPGNTGNVIEVSESTLGTSVFVSSWADLNTNSFTAATGYDYTGEGLGVCNTADSKCPEKAKPRTIDSTGNNSDWVLIVLPEPMLIESFTMSPDGNEVRDVTYFAGMFSTTNLEGVSYVDLIASGLTQVDVDSGAKSSADLVVTLTDYSVGPVFGNAILIGAGSTNTKVYLNQLNVSAVPLPAGAWLFLSAMGALAARRKLSA